MSRLILITFISLSWLLSSRVAFAGSEFEIKCTNVECAYTATIELGGAMMFEQATGYCLQQKKFVYLKWLRGLVVPADAPVIPPDAPAAEKEKRQKWLNERLKWMEAAKILATAPSANMVWNPLTGQTIELYKCPECPESFVPISTIQQLQHCPRCSKATLEHKRGVIYD